MAYLNFDGSGTLWWEADIVTSWSIPRGVEIADINSDGYPDVVAAAVNEDAEGTPLTTKEDASSHLLTRFRLWLPEEQILAEDAVYDIELHQSLGGYPVKTQIMELTGPFFADGFETGDFSAWE